MSEKKSKKKLTKLTTKKKINKTDQRTKKNKKLFLTAFLKNSCNITKACEAIKICRLTYYKWMDKDQKFKENVEKSQESLIDWAEGQLKKLMDGVVLPEDKIFCNREGEVTTVPTEKHYVPDNTSIIFFLKTKAKHRGYIEKQEIEHHGLTLEEIHNITLDKKDKKK